jgi:hypothetical protein
MKHYCKCRDWEWIEANCVNRGDCYIPKKLGGPCGILWNEAMSKFLVGKVHEVEFLPENVISESFSLMCVLGEEHNYCIPTWLIESFWSVEE